MIRSKAGKIIKTISLTLSILLIWQGVVWANPELFRRDHLLPESFSGQSHLTNYMPAITASYIEKILSVLEKDPENRNLYDMHKKAGEVLATLGKVEESVEIKISGASEKGEFFIDIDRCRIRFYNHRFPEAQDPGAGYKVVEDKQVSEYLSRQILLPETKSNGMVASGDALELFGAFQANPGIKELRPGIRKKLKKIMRVLKERLKKAELEEADRKTLAEVLDKSSGKEFLARFKEMNSIVLVDEEDNTKPKGWFLGFNTTEGTIAPDSDHSYELHRLIKSVKADTIALSSDVLDFAEVDVSLLQEYLFHELICPIFGHEKARSIQEARFPENYI